MSKGGSSADDLNAPKDGAKAIPKDGGSEPIGDEGEPLKPLNEEAVEEDKGRTKFSDERFAKLFPSRTGGRQLMPRPSSKPKPTLPSFIKSTPPLIRATVATTPVPRGQLNRARVGLGGQQQPQQQQQGSTRRGGSINSTTTPRPLRGRNVSAPTPRQLTGRLTTSFSTNGNSNRPTSAPNSPQSSATPSASALAAARRNRQGSGISRFQRNPNQNSNNQASLQTHNNSTIPALNPRRN